ncbi:hypothetical protein [Streptomyces sp. NBC_00459]|uniref:hypothetical protein n=1 Tax=Streptomyces sp. NBC_00459 TaxID=2975749 RepID=UPI002E16DD33
MGMQSNSVRKGRFGGVALACLVASLLPVIVGCSDRSPIPEPDIKLDAMVLPFGGIVDDECGGEYVTQKDVAGSGGDSRTLHATNWWNSRLGNTAAGCTLYHFVGFYGDAGFAEEVFDAQSPEKYYSRTWPWKPKFADAPEGLYAESSRLICLDGNRVAGCTEWYYWARYGSVLTAVSMSHLAGDPPKIKEGDFTRIVRNVDTRIHETLDAG